MKSYLTSTALIATLSVAGVAGSATGAAAGNNNAGALIIGALIGGAVVAGTQQQRRQNSASSAQRDENRSVQTALNYFEFNAGGVDGVFGRGTRAAISRYQAYMGFPATGELSNQEKAFLLNSYQRADLGGAETTRIVLTSGAQALLVSYFDDGGFNSGSSLGGGDLGSTQLVGGSDANAANDFGSSDDGGLPMFVTATEADSSMTAFCANGTVPQSPGAQFCSLRAFAIDDSDRIATTVQGATRADIQAQCEGFAPTMASYSQTAANSGTEALKSDLRAWAASAGATPASFEGIAKVCLGVGYQTDNADVAMASILALMGIGDNAYQELLAYHLAFGFNGEANQDQGADWLESVSVVYAGSDATIAGDNSAMRATLVAGMAGSLRGMPSFGTGDATVVPVAGEDTTGGFFSSGNN